MGSRLSPKGVFLSEVGGNLLSRMVKQMVNGRFVELCRTKMRGRKEDGLGSTPNPSFT
jgi:hypothetical protein